VVVVVASRQGAPKRRTDLSVSRLSIPQDARWLSTARCERGHIKITLSYYHSRRNIVAGGTPDEVDAATQMQGDYRPPGA
jgi:hypothetical protein